MYAVVGCTECSALWIVEVGPSGPERTECPRCGRSHQLDSLKRFVETDDKAHAREVRASMLANRQGEGEAFAELDHVAAMEDRLEDAGVDDDEYLAGSGLDPDAVESAGERAATGVGGTRSRKETVLDALDELDTPTEDAIVGYATEAGVPESYVRTALEKLVRAGEVRLDGDEYRRL